MAQAAYNSQIMKTSGAAIALTDEATAANAVRTQYTISNAAKRYLDIDTAVVVEAEHNEVQTVTIDATGGTFTLSFGGDATSAVAENASPATVEAELEGLPSIGANNVSVTGNAGGPWTVQFTGTLGNAAQALITGDGSLLTGGSTDVDVVEVQNGGSWAPVSATLYSIIYPGGVVIFASAQAIGTTVRLASGKYYAYATIGGGHAYEFSGKMHLEDTTEFNSTGTHTFTPTVKEGDLKFDVWYTNATYSSNLTAGSRLIASAVLPDASRFEGYCYYSDVSVKGETKGVLDQSMSMHFTEQFYMH